MTVKERVYFARQANSLRIKNPDSIKYASITVKKQNVKPHIHKHSNKLYNYMIGLSLLDEMEKHRTVTFVPDS